MLPKVDCAWAEIEKKTGSPSMSTHVNAVPKRLRLSRNRREDAAREIKEETFIKLCLIAAFISPAMQVKDYLHKGASGRRNDFFNVSLMGGSGRGGSILSGDGASAASSSFLWDLYASLIFHGLGSVVGLRVRQDH